MCLITEQAAIEFAKQVLYGLLIAGTFPLMVWISFHAQKIGRGE